MSKFTKEMVDDYANKLLIGLSDEENALVLKEFESIDESLNLVNQIPNLSDVEPMTHCLDNFECSLREDIIEDSIPVEDLLKNSDKTDGDEIEIPKVVG